MKSINRNDLLPHFSAVILFLFISLIYFSPVLKNQQLKPSDIMQFQGMAKEVVDYQKESDEEILWTNSMFSGMPTYQITAPGRPALLKQIHRLLNLGAKIRPLNFLFLYLLGFYIAMLAFRVDPWLSIIGAIAFALSTYFFIIIDAGHFSKATAIGYMPPIIGGVYLAFQRKIILGSLITSLFLALQLFANHLQITYYTLLIIFVFGIFKLVESLQQQTFRDLLLPAGGLILGVILAIGMNLTNLWTTYEYSKYSMRGNTELIREGETETNKGLDKQYATAWSYGIDETFTLLIPNFKGGSSTGSLSENSKTYELFSQFQGANYARQVIKQLPLYWGDKSFTSGPVYVGAFVLFLFIFGVITIRERIKWWLLTATILSILLAWGRHFMILTDLFLDYFPGYNKFRTVEMILVIAEFTIPVMTILAIQKIIKGQIPKKDFLKGWKYSLYITGGFALFFGLFAGMFSFTGVSDQNIQQQVLEVLQEDRLTILRQDAFRSLFFILTGAGVLYAFYLKKIKKSTFLIALGLIIIIDLWPVNKRYINDDDFVPKRESQVAFTPFEADIQILADPDPYYRVYDLTSNPFMSGRTSYFHRSIGGYHGAKLLRYNELIEFQISQNNMHILNMLNTKYFINLDEQQNPVSRLNPDALGNAWFVGSYRYVDNANQEMAALNDFDPSIEAIVDSRFENLLSGLQPGLDTSANIQLVQYHPNRLSYQAHLTKKQLTVFSDIFYEKGWNAYLNNEPIPHFRVNYVLRAAILPPGDHLIEFKFEPTSFNVGKRLAGLSSILFLLSLAGLITMETIRLKRKQ